MQIIPKGSKEWERMWHELGAHELNVGNCVCLNGEHKWRYVGTKSIDDNEWVHVFVHALHPSTGERVELMFPANQVLCRIAHDSF